MKVNLISGSSFFFVRPILVSALILVSAEEVRAQEANWSSFFPESQEQNIAESGKFFWKEEAALALGLLNGSNDCGKEIKDVAELFDEYRQTLLGQNQNFRPMRDFRKKLAEPLKAPCDEFLRRAYIVTSMASWVPWWDDQSKESILLRFRVQVWMTAAFLNLGRMEWMDSESRERLAQAGHAIAKEKYDGRYSINGLYDCSEGKIYLSSDLPPADLTGVLTHEYNHLFRDRNSGKDYQDSLRLTRDPEVFFSDSINDEFFSTLSGAFTQRGVFSQHYNGIGREDFHLLAPRGRMHDVYSAPDLWEASGFECFYQVLRHKMGWSQVGPNGPSCSLQAGRPWDAETKVRVGRAFSEVSAQIKAAYFGETESRNIAILRPFPLFPFERAMKGFFSIYRYSIPQFQQEFLKLLSQLGQKSEACTAYQRAARDGLLGSYIGASAAGKVGGGNSGVMPSVVVRPCLDLTVK